MAAFTENATQPGILNILDNLLQHHNRNYNELFGLRRYLKQYFMKFKSQIVMFITGNSALQIKLTNLKGRG